MPVNARITRKERKAAEAYCKRVATPLPGETDEEFVSRVSRRALSVLVRYGAGELPEEDLRNQDKETKARLREGLKAGKTTDDLKAEFYDDSQTQRHIADVLTVLGLVEDGESDESLVELSTAETETQDESGKVEPETTHQDEANEQKSEWSYRKVARRHKTTNDNNVVKAVRSAHAK